MQTDAYVSAAIMQMRGNGARPGRARSREAGVGFCAFFFPPARTRLSGAVAAAAENKKTPQKNNQKKVPARRENNAHKRPVGGSVWSCRLSRRFSVDQPPCRERACPNVSETGVGGGGVEKPREKGFFKKMFLDTDRRKRARVPAWA